MKVQLNKITFCYSQFEIKNIGLLNCKHLFHFSKHYHHWKFNDWIKYTYCLGGDNSRKSEQYFSNEPQHFIFRHNRFLLSLISCRKFRGLAPLSAEWYLRVFIPVHIGVMYLTEINTASPSEHFQLLKLNVRLTLNCFLFPEMFISRSEKYSNWDSGTTNCANTMYLFWLQSSRTLQMWNFKWSAICE